MKMLSPFAVTLLAGLLLTACGSSKEQTKVGEAAQASDQSLGNQPIQTETDGNTVIERIDVNNDAKPDVFKYYRLVEGGAAGPEKGADGAAAAIGGAAGATEKASKRMLIRKELDVNFDQRIDIVQYFEGKAGEEVMVREEMDLDFDGRVDSTRHYENGNVTQVELDLGFDGKTDTWAFYQLTTSEDGKPVNRLVERRRDTTGDGAIDVWEYYTKGNLTKLGSDSNADGTPDQFTRVDQK